MYMPGLGWGFLSGYNNTTDKNHNCPPDTVTYATPLLCAEWYKAIYAKANITFCANVHGTSLQFYVAQCLYFFLWFHQVTSSIISDSLRDPAIL